MTTVAEYVEAVVRRRREQLEPRDFEPDWQDRPRRHKVYPGMTRLPLPAGPHSASAPLAGAVTAPEPATEGSSGGKLSLGTLGELLRDSYGLYRRRVAIHPNPDLGLLPTSWSAVWSRGTASGGGLYPAEIYWVSGGNGPSLPGVYYYSTPHHAMQRLLLGDVTGQVRGAVGDDWLTERDDQFLLVSIKFWKNSFKYNSFCYHAITMDVGTLLGTWQLWARARGIHLRPAMWFDEPALNRLLGVPGHAESVFAVVPLPWAHAASPAAPDPEPADRSEDRAPHQPGVTAREAERSRRVIRFAQIENVHADTIHTSSARPDPSRLVDASSVTPKPSQSESVRLPAPETLDVDVTRALRARRSSFGRFAGQPRMAPQRLGTVLAAGAAGALASDLKEPGGAPSLTRLVVFVNHVDGLAPGSYAYDQVHHCLGVVRLGAAGEFLQRNYFLDNYNLEQAAAVLVVIARPRTVIDAIGPRGYRLVNAEVGAVAQAVYTACAALDLGCGAALGFDNVSYGEELGLAGTGEWPLLVLMIGAERVGEADLDFRIH